MSLLQNSNAISSGSYDINNSLRFRSSASANLTRTPASSGDRQKFTISVWIKRGTLSTEQAIITQGSGNRDIVRIGSDNLLYFYWYDATYYPVNTTQVFRDPSAWYHIVVSVDTTQATSSNRIRLYVNGSQITALSNAIYPSQNFNFTYWGTTNAIAIGKDIVANNAHLDGYMAEFNFIDGSQKAASDFGETDTTTGSWKPKAYTGTYGTNGFYLKFSDIATTSGSNAGLGKDFSGNANYWTTNNISVTAGTTYDAMTDVPTLTSATVANYCTLNPLDKFSSLPISNGNLNLNGGGNAGNWWSTNSTIWVSSGKWYWETTIGGSQYSVVGVSGLNQPISTNDRWVGFTSDSYGYYGDSGNKINNNSSTAYGSTFTAGDVIGVALDMDAGTLVFYKNNVSQGTAFTGLSGLKTPGFSVNDQGTDPFQNVNFGQRPFAYTPPTGFVRLNTFNLPDSTIVKGNTVMDATLWTGNGTSQTIVNAGAFRPDLVWIKQRSSTEQHQAMDSVRGASKVLNPNLTNAESTDATKLTAFNSNGFSVGSELAVNRSGFTYVGWQWQAGQGSTSSNTSGNVTSTVSVNATAGFSIVTYTGIGSSPKTVGHGLGVAPKMIILKNRGAAVNWYVWHTSLGATQAIEGLNTTAAATTQTTFNNTLPTSSVISLGNNDSNNSGATYVLYVWAEIAGFSKFGSYTGNGSTDGPFVYTGFRPKFIMAKRTDTAGFDWILTDSSRSPSNVVDKRLFANTNDAESSATTPYDYLSNGFKLRNTNANENASGGTYIFMAFAENPFKNANAR